MKRKKDKKLGPPQNPAPEPTTINTAAIHGVVVIRFTKQVGSLEMTPEQAIDLSSTIAAKARDAHTQRLEMELAVSQKRIAELEAEKKPKEA